MGWGPGKSRFTDPKRHFQKPLELSPLVAIDRERCILCYRCVRFSQEVAEDEQLQLLERGDKTFVGTFDERPYIAPFHGNIIELCPVGALTSYTYRFRARPWDIEQAGSVCTLCPSQCNVGFTVRDERVLRVNARDNAEVDDGWLCDKGRFAFQMFNSDDRITRPMVRAGDGSLSPICWDEAVKRVADGFRSAGERAAALVGGGTSNEEGWLVQRILRAGGSSNVDCSPNPVDPALLGELSRPDHGARMADLDHADAILVVGVDPLHEMPILDLRIRKAVRRSRAKLMVASERPTALDGGADEAVRYAPGDAASFLGALAGALGAEGYDAGGPFEDEADGDREDAARRSRPDDRLGRAALARAPARSRRCTPACTRSTCTSGSAPACSRSPRSRTRRGLREVGCLPGAKPGLEPTDGGRGSAQIKDGLAAHELGALLLVNADPVRTYPDSDGWRQALVRQLRGLDRLLRGRVDPARRHRHPGRDLGREGGHRHPSRGPPPAPAPQRPAARGHDPRLALPRRGRRRSSASGVDAEAPAEVFAALSAEVPFYDGADLRGDRRQRAALGRSQLRASRGLRPARRPAKQLGGRTR